MRQNDAKKFSLRATREKTLQELKISKKNSSTFFHAAPLVSLLLTQKRFNLKLIEVKINSPVLWTSKIVLTASSRRQQELVRYGCDTAKRKIKCEMKFIFWRTTEWWKKATLFQKLLNYELSDHRQRPKWKGNEAGKGDRRRHPVYAPYLWSGESTSVKLNLATFSFLFRRRSCNKRWVYILFVFNEFSFFLAASKQRKPQQNMVGSWMKLQLVQAQLNKVEFSVFCLPTRTNEKCKERRSSTPIFF